MADATEGSILITVIGVSEIVLILACLYLFPQLVGNPDNTNDLEKDLVPNVYYIALIVSIHTLLWYIYFKMFIQDSKSIDLYYLLATSASLFISLTALAASLIFKK